jgi:hypothetical protein
MMGLTHIHETELPNHRQGIDGLRGREQDPGVQMTWKRPVALTIFSL